MCCSTSWVLGEDCYEDVDGNVECTKDGLTTVHYVGIGGGTVALIVFAVIFRLACRYGCCYILTRQQRTQRHRQANANVEAPAVVTTVPYARQLDEK